MGSWVLVAGSVDGQAIPTSPELALRVAEGEFTFPLACNSGSVPYEVNGASIEFDAERFTQSEEGCTSLQADLFEMALLRTRSLSMDISENTLSLVGPDVSLQFDRQDP